MGAVTDFVLGMASSWWVVPILAVFACIDGFFPPVPAESLITGLAALAVDGVGVSLWGVWLAGIIGAGCGDSIAFLIGRKVPVHEVPVVRRFLTRSALLTAREHLEVRGASYLLVARFIPVGRVAVNMTAGACGLRYRQFLPISILASIIWASFAVVIGWGAGSVLRGHPLAAMVVGVVVGIVAGFVVDRIFMALGISKSRPRTDSELTSVK